MREFEGPLLPEPHECPTELLPVVAEHYRHQRSIADSDTAEWWCSCRIWDYESELIARSAGEA